MDCATPSIRRRGSSSCMSQRSVRIAVLLIAIGFVSVGIPAYSQTTSEDSISALNGKLVAALKARDFVLALEISERLLSEVRATNGADSMQMAIAEANRGSIQRQLGKFEEALVSLQTALAIRERLAVEDLHERLALMESAAFCNSQLKKYKEADTFYQSAIDLAIENKVRFSAGHFPLLLGAANTAARLNQLERAHQLYLVANRLSYEFFRVDSPEREELAVSRTCFFRTRPKAEQFDAEFENVSKRYEAEEKKQIDVVYGKALVLPPPSFGPVARANRIPGTAWVHVKLSAEGRVTSATALCSNMIYGPRAVSAARGAIFSPTLVGGKPIPTWAIIRYDFKF